MSGVQRKKSVSALKSSKPKGVGGDGVPRKRSVRFTANVVSSTSDGIALHGGNDEGHGEYRYTTEQWPKETWEYSSDDGSRTGASSQTGSSAVTEEPNEFDNDVRALLDDTRARGPKKAAAQFINPGSLEQWFVYALLDAMESRDAERGARLALLMDLEAELLHPQRPHPCTLKRFGATYRSSDQIGELKAYADELVAKGLALAMISGDEAFVEALYTRKVSARMRKCSREAHRQRSLLNKAEKWFGDHTGGGKQQPPRCSCEAEYRARAKVPVLGLADMWFTDTHPSTRCDCDAQGRHKGSLLVRLARVEARAAQHHNLRRCLKGGLDPNSVICDGDMERMHWMQDGTLEARFGKSTALTAAAEGANTRMLDLLLDSGADPEAFDCAVFAVAGRYGYTNFLQALLSHRVLQRKYDVMVRGCVVAMTAASIEKNQSTVDWLLQRLHHMSEWLERPSMSTLPRSGKKGGFAVSRKSRRGKPARHDALLEKDQGSAERRRSRASSSIVVAPNAMATEVAAKLVGLGLERYLYSKPEPVLPRRTTRSDSAEEDKEWAEAARAAKAYIQKDSSHRLDEPLPPPAPPTDGQIKTRIKSMSVATGRKIKSLFSAAPGRRKSGVPAPDAEYEYDDEDHEDHHDPYDEDRDADHAAPPPDPAEKKSSRRSRRKSKAAAKKMTSSPML